MSLKILGLTRDLRTNTPVVYAQASLSAYLHLIGEDFDAFSLQRRREKHKAYDRMKQDIKDGALLPSITLAVKPERVNELLPFFQQDDLIKLSKELSIPGRAHILDGMQRTYIIYDLSKEGFDFRAGQCVMLEFWLEKEIKHLTYRMIVLNAGQKPMSMRHQLELLFSTIKSEIERRISGLEIYTERDETRRRKARKYALDRLAIAYQCFLSASPEIDRKNVIAQNLIDESILESTENELSDKLDRFVKFLDRYAELDDHVCRIYSTERMDAGVPTGANWFGSENVMSSFFAAVAQSVAVEERVGRVTAALDKLHVKLAASQESDDPLGLETLHAIQVGLNPRKVNIGVATRRLLTNGFKEYFLDEGATSLAECWKRASE